MLNIHQMRLCDDINPRVVEFGIFDLFREFLLDYHMLELLLVVSIHDLVGCQLIEFPSLSLCKEFESIKSYLIDWIHIIDDHWEWFPTVIACTPLSRVE